MYNCVMYTAVTHAAETITGQSLGNFLRYQIWDPLGMRLIFWTLQDAVATEKEGKAQLATGYAWDPIESKYMTEPHPDFPAVSGSGAIISTVMDYSNGYVA
jgi:CubicO group peptidase (beta-lactamase class C family)